MCFKQTRITILMYHSIADDATTKFKPWAVSPALFAEHMAYLHQQAYTTITVSQLIASLSQAKPEFPEKTVILTFDDGFADFFTNAFPILKQYGFVATLYIPTAFVDGTSRWLEDEGEQFRQMLSWSQLAEICEYGIECGAHSHSHPQLDAIPWQVAREEMVQSKKILEHHLGRTISSFAYPFGYHSTRIKQLAHDIGYTSACTVKHIHATEKADPFALPRFTVFAWTNLYDLSKLLHPSFVSTTYNFASSAVWQLTRTCSASVARSLYSTDLLIKGLVLKSTMNTQISKISRNAMQDRDFIPIRIMELELGQPLPVISTYDEKVGKHYQRAKCLVRLHTQPLGVVDLTFQRDELKPEELAATIWQNLATQITQHLHKDGLPLAQKLTERGLPAPTLPLCLQERNEFLAQAPFVSIIVSTHNRPDKLPTCLDSLLTLAYPHYEIIVVDNAPANSATADLIQRRYTEQSNLRYVREDRPGLSWGRNCGIKAARGEILAFTDDDIIADSLWLTELVRGFRLADRVACVTGHILPLELETPAQVWLEECGGHGKGFTLQIFNSMSPHMHLYRAGLFGSGANMAFTSAFLQDVNGFDIALGAGSLARSAEEAAAFFQVIMHKHQLVYQPSAFIYHHDYRDYSDLCKQVYNYGVGFPAYLTKCLLQNPQLLLDLTTKIPYQIFRDLISQTTKHSEPLKPYVKELRNFRRRGMLYGLFACIRNKQLLLNFRVSHH